MSLKGNSTGSTREAIAEYAIATAAKYYGTDCVNATISNERVEQTFHDIDGQSVGSTFIAEWEGYIEHRWSNPTYGFPECRKCGISDYMRKR